MLHCEEEGRVKALGATIKLLDQWMKTVGTHPALRRCLKEYARRRGSVTMSSIVWREGPQLRGLGQSMDAIGWRRFLEGMIYGKVLEVQAICVALGG